MRLTVGPLPPAVYWRRRAIVLGVVLVALFLVAQACMSSAPADDRRAGEEPSPAPAPAPPTASASPDPGGEVGVAGPDEQDEPDDDADTGGEPGGDAGRCADSEIVVTARSQRDAFPATAGVEFTIRIEFGGTGSCQRDVGGAERELYLVRGSGADHVWSSRWCADPRGTDLVEMAPGWEPREHHIAFAGYGGHDCDDELSAGEYQLFARLGTAHSEPVEITLQ